MSCGKLLNRVEERERERHGVESGRDYDQLMMMDDRPFKQAITDEQVFPACFLLHVAQSHLILKDGPSFSSQLQKLCTVAFVVVTDGAHKYCNIICRISAGLNRFMIYAKLGSREVNITAGFNFFLPQCA